jgi:signal transduction histidine kinase
MDIALVVVVRFIVRLLVLLECDRRYGAPGFRHIAAATGISVAVIVAGRSSTANGQCHNRPMTAGIALPIPTIRSLAVPVGAVAFGALVLLFLPRSYAALTTYASASPVAAAADLAAGLMLLAAAAVVWPARRGGRLGLVAFLAGIAWFAPDVVGWAGGPSLLRTIGMVVAPFGLPLIADLAMLAPRGGIAPPIGRGIAAAYAMTVVVSLGAALFRDPYLDAGCWSNCTVNDLLVIHVEPARRALEVLWAGLALAVGLGLALVGWHRLVGAGRSTSAADPAGRVALAAAAVYGLAEAGRVAALVRAPVEDPADPILVALFVIRAAAVAVLAAAVAATVLVERRRRAAVARLALELGDAPTPGTLRQVLVRALGDPRLEVAYWLPDRGTYVDIDGVAVETPTPEEGRIVTPIVRAGERVAIVVHDSALPVADVAEEIGAAARLAVDNERLAAEVRAQLLDLRRSRARIVETGDAERRRLERDLHDGAQQRLLALSYELRLARGHAEDDGDERGADLLADAAEEARRAIDDLRDLAHGIFPALLAEAGLGPALESISGRATIPVELSVQLAGRCSDSTEMAAYVVALESVAAAEHRGAAYASIRAHVSGDELTVVVESHGGAANLDDSRLADRVGAVGGRLSVEQRAGAVTSVRADLPCA